MELLSGKDSRAATIATLRTYLSVFYGNESFEGRMCRDSVEVAEACPDIDF